MGDPAFRELGFEDRLGLLVNAEWNHRQSNKVERLMRTARFSAPFACVEEIEYHEDCFLQEQNPKSCKEKYRELHCIFHTVTAAGLVTF
jgi:hypothetical protein